MHAMARCHHHFPVYKHSHSEKKHTREKVHWSSAMHAMARCHHHFPVYKHSHSEKKITREKVHWPSAMHAMAHCHHHFPVYKHSHSEKKLQERKFIGPLPCMPWHTAIITFLYTNIVIQRKNYKRESSLALCHACHGTLPSSLSCIQT